MPTPEQKPIASSWRLPDVIREHLDTPGIAAYFLVDGQWIGPLEATLADDSTVIEGIQAPKNETDPVDWSRRPCWIDASRVAAFSYTFPQ